MIRNAKQRLEMANEWFVSVGEFIQKGFSIGEHMWNRLVCDISMIWIQISHND